MVKMPPERRKLSVLPYIINQFTHDSDSDEDYDEFEHSHHDFNNETAFNNYNEENGYEIIVGQDVGFGGGGLDEGSSRRTGNKRG